MLNLRKIRPFSIFNLAIFVSVVLFVLQTLILTSTNEVKSFAMRNMTIGNLFSFLINSTMQYQIENNSINTMQKSIISVLIIKIILFMTTNTLLALKIYIITEIMFQIIFFYKSFRIIGINQRAASLFTIAFINFQNFAPINLSNWGFTYLWNYAFALSIAFFILSKIVVIKYEYIISLTLLLFIIHPTICICIFLIVLPVLFKNIMQFIKTQVSLYNLVFSFIFSSIAIYNYTFKNSLNEYDHFDTVEYLKQIKAFQQHLFFDPLDLNLMSNFIYNFMIWFVLAASIGVFGGFRYPKNSTLTRIRTINIQILVVSLIGWFYSSISKPNPEFLLLALHRASQFTILLFILLSVVILSTNKKSKHNMLLFFGFILWILPNNKITNLLTICLFAIFFEIILISFFRNIKLRRDFITLVPLLFFGIYLFVIFSYTFVFKYSFSLFMILLIVFLISSYPFLRWLMKFRVFTQEALLVVIFIFCFSVQSFKTFENYRLEDSYNNQVERIDLLLDVANWAKQNSKKDANFMLPINDDNFGWSTFSQRTNLGQPRDWLHYNILYQRDSNAMKSGIYKFENLGIKLDNYLNRPLSQINTHHGVEIIKISNITYDNLATQDKILFARKIGATYLILEKPVKNLINYQVVYQNSSYAVLEM